jgi:hypothetical protein
LKWPSWDEFTTALKIFEQKISDAEFNGINYIGKFQDRHPILDENKNSKSNGNPADIYHNNDCKHGQRSHICSKNRHW